MPPRDQVALVDIDSRSCCATVEWNAFNVDTGLLNSSLISTEAAQVHDIEASGFYTRRDDVSDYAEEVRNRVGVFVVEPVLVHTYVKAADADRTRPLGKLCSITSTSRFPTDLASARPLGKLRRLTRTSRFQNDLAMAHSKRRSITRARRRCHCSLDAGAGN